MWRIHMHSADRAKSRQWRFEMARRNNALLDSGLSKATWRAAFKPLAALTLGSFLLVATAVSGPASAQGEKPNIVVITGDDVGWFNIGAYNQGIMAGKTPNLDQLASEGMRFTDYYAEPSCTAGRANFITGEFPIRTGLTTVGQAGSPIGIPDEAPTIATA